MKKIVKNFVNQKVLLFQRFQANAKEIQCPLLQWNTHEMIFPIVGLFAKHILGIIGSKIKI
jgi:hypothetical protein